MTCPGSPLDDLHLQLDAEEDPKIQHSESRVEDVVMLSTARI